MQPTSGVVSYIGFAAGFFTIISFMPQVVRSFKTKQVKDLSKGTVALLITAAIVWIAYGFMSKDLPVIVTNISTLMLSIALMVAKVRYGKNS